MIRIALLGCGRIGRMPVVGFEDGRRALILAEAAMKSAIEGRFVSIDEVA